MDVFIRRQIIIAILCCLIYCEYLVMVVEGKVMYNYVHYPYRKKPKLERQFKISMRQCERSDECGREQGLDLIRCARICTAPACYWEIYGHDELEHGEIDVRSSSFKGCWTKVYNRPNKVDL